MADSDKSLEVTNTNLAYNRTILAYERTLMAWVRTAISMISFGFTIYKFFQEVTLKGQERHGLLTPRIFGLVMIGFGLLALILAQIQHQMAMRKLRKEHPGIQRSISYILSVLVVVFGLAFFLAVFFRQ